MKPILTSDLDAGCLTSAYPEAPGQPTRRRIWYLDDLFADIIGERIALCWLELPPGRKAACSLTHRTIYLSPSLYTRSPCRIRRALTHELTHIRLGKSCEEEIREWQWRLYGPILLPEWERPMDTRPRSTLRLRGFESA